MTSAILRSATDTGRDAPAAFVKAAEMPEADPHGVAMDERPVYTPVTAYRSDPLQLESEIIGSEDVFGSTALQYEQVELHDEDMLASASALQHGEGHFDGHSGGSVASSYHAEEPPLSQPNCEISKEFLKDDSAPVRMPFLHSDLPGAQSGADNERPSLTPVTPFRPPQPTEAGPETESHVPFMNLEQNGSRNAIHNGIEVPSLRLPAADHGRDDDEGEFRDGNGLLPLLPFGGTTYRSDYTAREQPDHNRMVPVLSRAMETENHPFAFSAGPEERSNDGGYSSLGSPMRSVDSKQYLLSKSTSSCSVDDQGSNRIKPIWGSNFGDGPMGRDESMMVRAPSMFEVGAKDRSSSLSQCIAHTVWRSPLSVLFPLLRQPPFHRVGFQSRS